MRILAGAAGPGATASAAPGPTKPPSMPAHPLPRAHLAAGVLGQSSQGGQVHVGGPKGKDVAADLRMCVAWGEVGRGGVVGTMLSHAIPLQIGRPYSQPARW